jgi:hypothetical protein
MKPKEEKKQKSLPQIHNNKFIDYGFFKKYMR